MREPTSILRPGDASDRQVALMLAWLSVPLPVAAVVVPQVMWQSDSWNDDPLRYCFTPLVLALFWMMARGAEQLTGVGPSRRERRAVVMVAAATGALLADAALLALGIVDVAEAGLGDGFAFLGQSCLALQWGAAACAAAAAATRAWRIGHPALHHRPWGIAA
jgi:hypothetical protein